MAFTESVYLRTWIESPLGSGRELIGSAQPFMYSLKCFVILLFDLKNILYFDVENISDVKILTLEVPMKYFLRGKFSDLWYTYHMHPCNHNH